MRDRPWEFPLLQSAMHSHGDLSSANSQFTVGCSGNQAKANTLLWSIQIQEGRCQSFKLSLGCGSIGRESAMFISTTTLGLVQCKPHRLLPHNADSLFAK